ncbi:MAG: hypothetical protein QGF00_11710 [Planctomycetota bacterium]|nr:hypothetical protein [Planctomycetota bacterium]MDP7250258.1 hypothetical protein [Planctomycetota bacterium]
MRIICICASAMLIVSGLVDAQETQKNKPEVKVKTSRSTVGAGSYGYNSYRYGANIPNYPTDILTRYFQLDGRSVRAELRR